MKIDYQTALKIQRGLLSRWKLEKLPSSSVEIIGGVDVSYDKGTNLSFCAIVLFSYPQLEKLEVGTAYLPTTFPYIPGLLSFREFEVIEKAFKGLKIKPDLLIFDGQGIAHPRRMGLATHAGILLDIPTIGCAKSRLYGEYKEPDLEKGDYTSLLSPKKRELLGYVYRSRSRVKPIFISPGHLVDFGDVLHYISTTLTKYRLPEPTRQAHKEVNLFRKKYLGLT